MSSPFTEEVLGRLSEFATAEFGLRFPPDRWHELGRGIASAALGLGVSDLNGWAENLAAGKLGTEDRVSVANHLTISETYFFRHPETFTALERTILPARIEERRREIRPLRIWSAGCASGEEPYSVAILLRHAFPKVRTDSIVISGTDLNTHVIKRAAQGVYSEWSFRDVPAWLKSGYFTRTPRGHYQIAPEIRDLVRFSQLNLAAPLFPAEFGERGDFDVILCRNVLMYFSAEWQDKIIRRFTQALAPGGWLIVGPCDVTTTESNELSLHSTSPGIYQKQDGAKAKGPVAPERKRVANAGAVVPTPTKSDAAASADVRPTLPEPSPKTELPAPVPVQEKRADTVVATEALPEAADLSSLARRHANRGELSEALAACDQAIKADNLNPALHHLRGCVLLELDRPAEAEDAFRRVLYLDPASVMAEFSLASLAQRAGRADEARHRFVVVLRLLAGHHRGEAVPDGEGVTVARLQDVVERTLNDNAA